MVGVPIAYVVARVRSTLATLLDIVAELRPLASRALPHPASELGEHLTISGGSSFQTNWAAREGGAVHIDASSTLDIHGAPISQKRAPRLKQAILAPAP